MKIILTAAMAASALALAACGETAPEGMNQAVEEQGGNLAAGIGEDSRFAAAMEEAGLTGLLDGPVPYTIIVPADAAFDALADAEYENDEARKEALGQLLSAHILNGTILSEDIANAIASGDGAAELPNMAGSSLTAQKDGDAITLSLAEGSTVRVTAADERYDNGVIHRVDGLLTS